MNTRHGYIIQTAYSFYENSEDVLAAIENLIHSELYLTHEEMLEVIEQIIGIHEEETNA